MHWRLLLSPPLDGPGNMGLDHALMQHARTSGEAVLRVYSWNAPVLSLGRNQRARDVYDLDHLARCGVSVVRRPTGGRALLHHREITYSVVAPVVPAAGLSAVYDRINALLLHALRSLGVAASVAAPAARAPFPSAAPCFAEPSAGEIVAGSRKLVGSAQWRDNNALLQHGSILVDDDQWMIPSFMRSQSAASPAPATLRQMIGGAPSVDVVADALFGAVRHMEDERASPLSNDELDASKTAQFADQYRDPAWTWRR